MLRFKLSICLSLLLSVALASGSRAITFADGGSHGVNTAYGWVTVEDGPGATTTTVSMSGGAVGGHLRIWNDSQLEMFGGYVRNELSSRNDSIITIRGGEIEATIHAYDSSTIYIVGSGFAVDGVQVPYGDLAAPNGTLTGTLASGDLLDTEFHQGCQFNCTGTITLVPEPSTVVLLGLGLAGLALRRRPSA